jgi:hypothetical protein
MVTPGSDTGRWREWTKPNRWPSTGIHDLRDAVVGQTAGDFDRDRAHAGDLAPFAGDRGARMSAWESIHTWTMASGPPDPPTSLSDNAFEVLKGTTRVAARPANPLP